MLLLEVFGNLIFEILLLIGESSSGRYPWKRKRKSRKEHEKRI